jgi:cytochrome c553
LKGAGHYETGCRPCHGSPDLPQPRVARALKPRPPYLGPRIAAWEPEELFYIVKHGIKFTGMPAWPSLDRDDEVQAMIAFLLALPGLDAGRYRRLVHGATSAGGSAEPLPDMAGPLRTPDLVLTSCARCHGVSGHGRELAAFPKLAGQREGYLFAALEAFARDERASGIMQPIAAGLSAEEMRALARYYGAQPAQPPPEARVDTLQESIGRGREIATRGIPNEKVPACRHCHGPGGGRPNPAYPELVGQFPDYLALQLGLFKAHRRGGSRYAHIMSRVAAGLGPVQMRDVANYYGSAERAGGGGLP